MNHETCNDRELADDIEVKPLGHILRDEYARLVVKNEAAMAARILAAANHVEVTEEN